MTLGFDRPRTSYELEAALASCNDYVDTLHPVALSMFTGKPVGQSDSHGRRTTSSFPQLFEVC